MESEKLEKRALFYTNMAYIMADIANGFALDAQSALNQLHKMMSRDKKKMFAQAEEYAKRAKMLTKDACKEIYEIDSVSDACDDSDFLQYCLLLIIDRVGENQAEKDRIIESLRNNPSMNHLGMLLYGEEKDI